MGGLAPGRYRRPRRLEPRVAPAAGGGDMTELPDPTRVYLRAWTTRSTPPKSTGRRGRAHTSDIDKILVLDPETSVDPAQRLTFGSARYYWVDCTDEQVQLVLRQEWLFHATDLPDRGPPRLLFF